MIEYLLILKIEKPISIITHTDFLLNPAFQHTAHDFKSFLKLGGKGLAEFLRIACLHGFEAVEDLGDGVVGRFFLFFCNGFF